MNVNFNNLRAQAAYALDNLTSKLNDGLLKESDGSPKYEISDQKDSHGKEIWVRGNILIDSRDIQKNMEELRSLIMTINAVYEPNDPDFIDMTSEISKNGGCCHFNEEED